MYVFFLDSKKMMEYKQWCVNSQMTCSLTSLWTEHDQKYFMKEAAIVEFPRSELDFVFIALLLN